MKARTGKARIDRIVKVRGAPLEHARTLRGTPTRGATVYNLLGAPVVPAGHEVVSTVMVPERIWEREA